MSVTHPNTNTEANVCVSKQSTHRHTHAYAQQPGELCVCGRAQQQLRVLLQQSTFIKPNKQKHLVCDVTLQCTNQTTQLNRERERCSASSGLSALLSVCTSAEFVILDMNCLIKCKNAYSLPQQAWWWWYVNWSITLCQIQISNQLLDGSLLFISGFEINNKKTFCLPLMLDYASAHKLFTHRHFRMSAGSVCMQFSNEICRK